MYSRIVSISLLAASLSGASEKAIRLTPESAIARAMASNKHLRGADLEIRRAQIRLFWEGRLDNPQLEVVRELGRGVG